MSQFVFKMPDLGEGTVEAEIIAWHTTPGATVAEDQIIVEVMTDKAAVLAFVTHMLCWSCGMYFSAAASSENDHGSMNFASNTAPVASTTPSRVGAIHLITG